MLVLFHLRLQGTDLTGSHIGYRTSRLDYPVYKGPLGHRVEVILRGPAYYISYWNGGIGAILTHLGLHPLDQLLGLRFNVENLAQYINVLIYYQRSWCLSLPL